MKTIAEHIIVALDVPSSGEALALVETLGEEAAFYKVGAELFTAAGPDLVRALLEQDKKVFLDLKYHDIPTTVGRAVARAAELGAAFLSLHAAGGR